VRVISGSPFFNDTVVSARLNVVKGVKGTNQVVGFERS
jgi:hypothetical protein